MEHIAASVGAEVAIAIDGIHDATGTQWTWMTPVVARVGITIEAVGEPVPDQGRLTMTDTIDLEAEVVEMTMIGHEIEALAVSVMEAGRGPPVPRQRPNPPHRSPQRMNVIGALFSYSNLLRD